MAATTEKKRIDIVDELKRLDFISMFFSWIFMLMSRLAEPLMLLSAMYIIIEAGIPKASQPWLHDGSVGLMITAPEVILPGAFVLAAQARSQGKKSGLLFTTCIVFIILTLVTLLSLFVCHFNQNVLNFIMFLRCAAGIGYSILIRIHSYTERGEEKAAKNVTQPAPIIQVVEPKITDEHIARIVSLLADQVTGATQETVSRYLQNLPLETMLKTVVETAQNRNTVIPPKTEKPSITRPLTTHSETTRRTTKRPGRRGGKITSINRRIVTDEMVERAYSELLAENGKVTADALKEKAGIGKPRACAWLRDHSSQNVEAEALA